MKHSAYFTDGEAIKGVNLPVSLDGETGWNILGDTSLLADKDLYYKVSAVYRAAQLQASALSGLPFALVDAAGSDYDTSSDWRNRVGFMPRPVDLLRLWRLSLFMTNAAYGFMETRPRRGALLRYIAPSTIEPVVDAERGITGFKREVGASTGFYAVGERRIFWVHRLDWDTELLPSAATEFGALANAAEITHWADEWVKHYFRRGGIRPTMLLVKGVSPNREEREKLEGVWQRFISRIGNFGKVFNADAVEPKVIGDGVGDLGDNSIYRQALENIAMASGIPLSMLLSNSANHATAQEELSTWYQYSVVPYAMWLADEMTDKLFEPLGLRFEFRPEQSDPDTDADKSRAEAFALYVGAGMKPSAAAEIAGIELPAGMDYDDIWVEDDPERPPAPQQPQPEPQTDDGVTPPEPLPAVRAFVPTAEQVKEIDVWRSLAERKVKRGDNMTFNFEVRTLPGWYAKSVAAALPACKDAEDVAAAFSPLSAPDNDTGAVCRSSDLLQLADAINRAVDLDARKSLDAPPSAALMQPIINITMPPITLTAQMPAQDAASYTITMPEQPAPTVTVINEVQPAPVEVANNVTVQPAAISMPEFPRSARVKRDIDGRIDGIVTED